MRSFPSASKISLKPGLAKANNQALIVRLFRRHRPPFDQSSSPPMNRNSFLIAIACLAAGFAPLQAAGTPGFSPLVDARHYFDYHHTAADTLDKVDPQNLKSQVATMAVLAYYLAQLPEPLPRIPAHSP